MSNALLLRRRGMMGAATPPVPVIPYQRIEYLESNGGQVILANYSGDGTAIIDAQGTGTKSNTQILVAAAINGGAGTWFGIPGGKTKWGPGPTVLFSDDYNSRIVATVNFLNNTNISVTINGVTKTRSGSTAHASWGLFATTNITLGYIGRIYSCKIYNTSMQLVREFYPVRDGTVGYLYDAVSGELHGNRGTGDFILGPDVQ